MTIEGLAAEVAALKSQVNGLPVSPNPWGQPAVIIAALSMAVSLFAFVNARAARVEAKVARRHEFTQSLIQTYRSPMQRRKREWLRTNLGAFAKENRLANMCGLKAMRTGRTVKLVASDGTTETLLAGDIGRDVMDNLEDIARSIRHGTVHNIALLQTLGDDVITTWAALAPWMPGRWSPEYYQVTSGRWNIRSLVDTIKPFQSSTERNAAILRRWGSGDHI